VRVHQDILTEGFVAKLDAAPTTVAAPPFVVFGVARWKRPRTYAKTVGLSTKEDPLRLAASSLASSVGETDLKDGNWVGETLEIERSLGVEIEALPNTEIPHCCRHGDAAWRGYSAKSCRQLNRRPE
jgi:hypothetical protein